jgi:hypothetical protein
MANTIFPTTVLCRKLCTDPLIDSSYTRTVSFPISTVPVFKTEHAVNFNFVTNRIVEINVITFRLVPFLALLNAYM